VQKYFMRTRMHGTPSGRPDYKDKHIVRECALRIALTRSIFQPKMH